VIPQTIAQIASCRLLLIVAHPDDEIIGAGALLSHTQDARIVHVTEGSPENPADALAAGFATREEYAAARIAETHTALALVGNRSDAISNWHYTDQQVSFRLPELTRDLLLLLESERPSVVLTHAYEGGHPDHNSVAFACHLALEIHYANHDPTATRLMEFAAYNGHGGGMKTYEFLPRTGVAEITHELTPEEHDLKIAMLKSFKSQAKTLEAFFPPRIEGFRHAPEYDFTVAPNEGPLLYEHFPWGMDGLTWRGLAREALRELRSVFPAATTVRSDT
jgi:LmbE family N-acetylglucosaminyl deacetylase